MSLRDYLESFHNALSKIEDYGFADSTDINVEIRASKQAVNKVRIVLVDHKHLNDGTVIECPAPDISDVVDEVISHI